MDTLDDIKRAIQRLTSAQRRDMELWIREVAHVEDGVREPRAEYAAAPPHDLYAGGELFAMAGATNRHRARVLERTADLSFSLP